MSDGLVTAPNSTLTSTLSGLSPTSGLVTSTARNQLLNVLREQGVSTQGPTSNAQGSGVANPYGRSLGAFEPNTQVYTGESTVAGESQSGQAGASQAGQAGQDVSIAQAAGTDPTSSKTSAQTLASGLSPADLTAGDNPLKDQQDAADAASKAATNASFATGGIVDASGRVQAMVSAALQLAAKGVPYVWGGTTASGVDCSGLIYYAANAAGIPWQRYRSVDYGKMGTEVDAGHARPGDIVFYDEGNGNGHVGIYLGNGMMVAAPQSGEDVQVQSVYGKPTSIRRIFTDNSFGTSATPNGGATFSYGGKVWNPAGGNADSTGTVQMGYGQAQLTGIFNTLGSIFNPARTTGVGALYGNEGMNDTQWSAYLNHRGIAQPENGANDGVAYTGGIVGGSTIKGNVPYAAQFQQAGVQYGVPPALLAAVARQESGFNPTARSSAGAMGLMQFMPGTARGLGVNPLDPSSAITGAARYLAGLYAEFGRWDWALAAYNAGAGAVRQYGGIPPYAETQNYVRAVTSNENQYAGG